MSYKVGWIIDNHVLYIQFTDKLTLDDLRVSSKQIAEHLATANKEAPENAIIGLIDMSTADLESLFWSALSVIVKQVADVIDPRLWKAKPGFAVLISTSELAKSAIALVIKISSQPMTSVASLEEALSTISAMYPELQDALDTYAKENFTGSAD